LSLRRAIRKLFPRLVRSVVSSRVALQRRKNERLSAREVFTRVYATNSWGGEKGIYCSGAGSEPAVADQYCRFVREFIREKQISRVVDLGCGDFRVGSRIATPRISYIGVDVVDSLIQHNRDQHGTSQIQFLCLDISRDELPPGELCLVRQVFQHLSNSEILAVLEKLSAYRYVLVTEHYPAHGRLTEYNRDKPHGADTRVIDNSAVCLDRPPFQVPGIRLALEVPANLGLRNEGERLLTFLIENSEPGASELA
jgi:hypothetical protein